MKVSMKRFIMMSAGVLILVFALIAMPGENVVPHANAQLACDPNQTVCEACNPACPLECAQGCSTPGGCSSPEYPACPAGSGITSVVSSTLSTGGTSNTSGTGNSGTNLTMARPAVAVLTLRPVPYRAPAHPSVRAGKRAGMTTSHGVPRTAWFRAHAIPLI